MCHTPLLPTSLSFWCYSLVAALKVPNCSSPLHSFRCLGFPVLNSASNSYALIPSVSSIFIPSALLLLGISWQDLFCRVRETASLLTTYWRIRHPYLCPSETGWSSYTPGHTVSILVNSYDTHGLRWGYSYSLPPHRKSLVYTTVIIFVSSKNYKAYHFAVFFTFLSFSLLNPKTLPTTHFHNTVSICFSRNMRDIISKPHKTQAKLLSRIFRFLCCKTENRTTNYSGLNINKHSPTIVFMIIYSCTQFLFVSVFPRLSKFATFSHDLLSILMLGFFPAFIRS